MPTTSPNFLFSNKNRFQNLGKHIVSSQKISLVKKSAKKFGKKLHFQLCDYISLNNIMADLGTKKEILKIHVFEY